MPHFDALEVISLSHLCTPRATAFERARADTVANIADFNSGQIDGDDTREIHSLAPGVAISAGRCGRGRLVRIRVKGSRVLRHRHHGVRPQPTLRASRRLFAPVILLARLTRLASAADNASMCAPPAFSAALSIAR